MERFRGGLVFTAHRSLYYSILGSRVITKKKKKKKEAHLLQGLGFRGWGSGFGVQGLGFGVWGSGFGGSGCRVQGFG